MLSAAALNIGAATLPSEDALVIEPATTWAGIARVHLQIENLRQTGEVLEGTYQIRVPLSPTEDDSGRILLHSSASFDELGEAVATAIGSAVSSTGQVNEVVARTQPNGVIRIEVVTPKRTLRFKSRYVSR